MAFVPLIVDVVERQDDAHDLAVVFQEVRIDGEPAPHSPGNVDSYDDVQAGLART